MAQGRPILHAGKGMIQRGHTWRLQEWRGARPSNPGTQTTLALLLVTWLTVTLRGGRGMATKETKRPFSMHRTEQVFTWKWQRLEARSYAMKWYNITSLKSAPDCHEWNYYNWTSYWHPFFNSPAYLLDVYRQQLISLIATAVYDVYTLATQPPDIVNQIRALKPLPWSSPPKQICQHQWKGGLL